MGNSQSINELIAQRRKRKAQLSSTKPDKLSEHLEMGYLRGEVLRACQRMKRLTARRRRKSRMSMQNKRWRQNFAHESII
jgi:hypothetical protein